MHFPQPVPPVEPGSAVLDSALLLEQVAVLREQVAGLPDRFVVLPEQVVGVSVRAVVLRDRAAGPSVGSRRSAPVEAAHSRPVNPGGLVVR